jgi:hypothetical protein
MNNLKPWLDAAAAAARERRCRVLNPRADRPLRLFWSRGASLGEVIDRKRFRPIIRPKIIGQIFGRNKYSASAAENEKSPI